MQELEVKRERLLDALSIEYLPAIPDERLELGTAKRLPLANLAALGVGFEPLVSVVQSAINQGTGGGSGIYYVNARGRQMFQSKQGAGFIGSLQTVEGGVGGGQAIMTPLVCDPTMLFMAAALMNIERKLDSIQVLQEEMMSYLKAKEKAKLRGNLNVLNDVLNNYRFNWNNEKYKTNKHILVQDIRKDAEESIQLFRDQIGKKLSQKVLINNDQEIKSTLRELQDEFKNYQLALYLFSYSSFMEVMLLENFDSQYLKSVTGRIEEYTMHFRELYTNCYNQVEGNSKTTVESILIKGVANLSKGAGEMIAKIPVVNKGPMNEALIAAGNNLNNLNDRKTEDIMKKLVSVAASCTTPFVDNIKMVDRMFNKPFDILFDNSNIYFLEDTAL